MNRTISTQNLPLPEKPDLTQAARYMGVHKMDTTTRALLEGWAPSLWEAARPRGAWVCLPLEELSHWTLGKDLERHFQNCTHAMLAALTLGVEVDRLIRRLSATELAGALAVDALASALVEQVANAWEKDRRRELEGEGLYLTGRFGPGYGDSPLALQGDLCRVLDTSRKMGLSLTPTLLLAPTKSTTALLGISDIPVRGTLAGCGNCKLKEICEYRKRGTTCGVEGMD